MASAVHPLFQPATKATAKLRMVLIGIAGSGKTLSALLIAQGLGQKIAVIDTERGRASKYAHKFHFDVLELSSMHPQRYIEGIQAASTAGYEVLIIDSLSHAWMGKDGALELVDKAAQASKSTNMFAAWRDVTPLHVKLLDTIMSTNCHVICTLRSKARYEMEQDRNGKMVPKKLGMEAIQRDGIEYEFDVVGDLDLAHTLTISKSVLDSIHPGDTIVLPDEGLGQTMLDDLRGTVPVESLGSLRVQINAWVTGLQRDHRRPAVQAVFGCPIEHMPQLALEALQRGIALVREAQAASIHWDSPTLAQDLTHLSWPEDDAPSADSPTSQLPDMPGPAETPSPPDQRAYLAQLRRNLMRLIEQLPVDQVPGEARDLLDDLTATPMRLEEWCETLRNLASVEG